MIEKRLIVDEDYNIVDTLTGAKLDDTQMFVLVNKLYDENSQLKLRIQLLSTLVDNADAIIDLSNDEIAKAFWKRRNNEVEQEYKMKYQKKGDVE